MNYLVWGKSHILAMEGRTFYLERISNRIHRFDYIQKISCDQKIDNNILKDD